MSHILLTGGLGFIGSHIAISLLEAGHEVTILDNLHNSDRSVLKSIAQITGKEPVFAEGDITDINGMCKVLSDSSRPTDAVIHLAALKSVSDSVAMPVEYYKTNIGGLLELMRAMREVNCHNLIFSSSATIYGEATQLPITEEAYIRPTNPYGTSKATCEFILKNTADNEPEWNIISLRYFNPAGCHPSAFLGEKIDGGSQNLFVAIMRHYLRSNYQLKVFGTNYDTKDGTCIRDYVHITDLARAHLLATEKVISGPVSSSPSLPKNCLAINLGSGTGYTVLEVLKTFEKLTGKSLSYEVADPRAGDVPAGYTSVELAGSLLNWKPKENLETICRDTLRYIRRQQADTKQQ